MSIFKNEVEFYGKKNQSFDNLQLDSQRTILAAYIQENYMGKWNEFDIIAEADEYNRLPIVLLNLLKGTSRCKEIAAETLIQNVEKFFHDSVAKAYEEVIEQLYYSDTSNELEITKHLDDKQRFRDIKDYNKNIMQNFFGQQGGF